MMKSSLGNIVLTILPLKLFFIKFYLKVLGKFSMIFWPKIGKGRILKDECLNLYLNIKYIMSIYLHIILRHFITLKASLSFY